MNLVKSSLKYPQVMWVIVILAFGVGIHSLLNMPRREDPKITIRSGIVAAYFPGASAEQVENQVTKKIEEYLFQYEEVRKEKTYSTTKDGQVIVNVELEEWVKDPDMFWSKLRHDLNELHALKLPDGVVGPLVDSDFGDTIALLVTVQSDRHSYTELKEFITQLEDKLRTIRATSKVKRYGEQKEQVYITLDNAKLSQYSISHQQIIGVLTNQNVIKPTGSVKTGDTQVEFHASGLYQTEEDVKRQIVGMSHEGNPVTIADIATVERKMQEPQSFTRVDGSNVMLVSLEMQPGKNIVKFGEEVDAQLAEFSKMIPADVKVKTMVNQPKVVEESVLHFEKEFLIAIISVIIVTIVLLPFNVATISALAIPVTIAVTFGVLNMMGIELHQVSLAGLVVVLGMVVDDAIVIGDNYVELLDQKENRWKAAWRSASELAIPVLTATLTIIASFLPLAFLEGVTGEFVYSLPITVAIALGCSYVVAMLLTPILCYKIIKKGLHAVKPEHTGSTEPKSKNKIKFSPLETMQNVYDRAIGVAMNRPWVTIGSGIAVVAAGAFMMQFLPDKFFPAAERDQLVVEVWMPTATKLEKTDEAARRIENFIKQDKRVKEFATFVGTSAPRFYYNLDPVSPSSNYAQFMINTTSVKATEELAHEWEGTIETLVPEGRVQVKVLQQGPLYRAPVEIRIIGEDITELKAIGEQVMAIIDSVPGSTHVHRDFREDQYALSLNVNDNMANRLGFSNSDIATSVALNFEGMAVSTLWEGDESVDIVLRADEKQRESFDDLSNTYVTSSKGAQAPLRQLATVEPSWQTGQIMHRNGVRTLSILGYSQLDGYPSEVLATARPEIDKLNLPANYRIEYGGEIEEQTRSFNNMITALLISLVSIFLILVFQFRSVKEASIVMASIPLGLFGAVLGLIITGNPFGFTAFLGIISLSGIVVRNAIILVDYINERIKHGLTIREASFEAGKRRLRPIFLTTMAAAVGVLPMILSGSALWSPLASVLAVGLIFSMVFTLLVIPVLYVLWVKPADKNSTANPEAEETISNEQPKTAMHPKTLAGATMVIALLISFVFPASAQNTANLSLETAIETAVQNNRNLKMAALQIDANEHKVNQWQKKNMPQVTVNSTYAFQTDPVNVGVPAGTFGNGEIPSEDIELMEGDHFFYQSEATIYQPLTQIVQIKTGKEIAETDAEIAREEYNSVESAIRTSVEKLYYNILIAEYRKIEAEYNVALARQMYVDANNQFEAGIALEAATIGLNAEIYAEEQELIQIENAIHNMTIDMNTLLGLPLNTKLNLQGVGSFHPANVQPLDQLTSLAMANNPDVRSAELNQKKAAYGVTYARQEYLPEIGAFGTYQWQKGNPVTPENNTYAGICMSVNLFDFGQRRSVVKEQMVYVNQANENFSLVVDDVLGRVEKLYGQLESDKKLIEAAQSARDLRAEELRIVKSQVDAGLTLKQQQTEAQANLAEAEADLLSAELGYKTSLCELNALTGSHD